MLLTNHALTGVVLATYIENELVLAPVAFMSHLALDSLPHFGLPDFDFKKPKGFIIGTLDFVGALTVLAVSLALAPERTVQTATGWFFAVMPDLFYLAEIFFSRTLFPAFRRLHARVQWSETPAGTFVDAVWAAAMLSVLYLRL